MRQFCRRCLLGLFALSLLFSGSFSGSVCGASPQAPAPGVAEEIWVPVVSDQQWVVRSNESSAARVLEGHSAEAEGIELTLRKWVQAGATHRRIRVLISGEVGWDTGSDFLVWYPTGSGGGRIPVERLFKYLSVADPNFSLIACLRVVADQLPEVARALDQLLTDGNVRHRVILMGGCRDTPGLTPADGGVATWVGEYFQKAMQSDSEKEPEITEVVQRVNCEGYWIRWDEPHFTATEEGVSWTNVSEERHLESGATNAGQTISSPMPEERQQSPEFDLNFDETGRKLQKTDTCPFETEVGEWPTDQMAIRGFSMDLLEHGGFHPSIQWKDGLDALDREHCWRGMVWVLWVLPKHLSADLQRLSVLDLVNPSGIRMQLVLEVEGERYRLGLISESTQASLDPSISVGPELVEGVWNLVALQPEVAPGGMKIERLYPVNWFRIPEWKPEYDLVQETVAVRETMEKPQLLLDSVRGFRTDNPCSLFWLEAERYARFELSQMVYSDIQQIEKSIRRETHGKGVLADWENLVACFSGEGERFIAAFDLEFEEGFLVKRAGERYFNDERQYFFNRFDHQPRSSFLAHDQIDDHLLTLGSWTRLYLRALCEWIRSPEDKEH